MNQERYARVMRIIDEVMDGEPEGRAVILNQACDGDESLRREAERLLAHHAASNDFLEESPLDAMPGAYIEDSMTGKRIGAYRIVREIGRGGMGAVYEAARDDDQYQTRVAIKIIKRGMDTDFILRRFRNERQILARLNHPHIARLLDGGTTEDGLPYFVMECVEGQPITEYADERRLANDERLKLFRAVCSAVQYAHQNLVIHRDIKPGNILVTAEGVPKLLDFGIAKLLHPDLSSQVTALTAAELRAMTPEYASPEQVCGGTITTASDVYSLGVLLYELLTGRLPYRFKTRRADDIMRAVCEQEPDKPSDSIAECGMRNAESKTAPQSAIANPKSLRGDLDKIVLLALRKEPHRRYASVEQFSADINRYTNNLPVIAHKDSLRYRSAKFVRRNRLGMIAASLVLITLVGGIVATGWQARVARQERARAERRFNDVRNLANSFMFEINDEIAREPTRARELLVKRALEYLDSLAQEAGGDIALQRELATAYQKVGDVQSELHRPNIGDSRGALESYRKSLALREKLFVTPNDIQAGLDLSVSYNKAGDILAKTGDTRSALENYRKALNLDERLTLIDPENPEVRRELSKSHIAVGRALLKTGALPEVLENFRRALSIRETLAAENPANARFQRDLPLVYEVLGYALTESGDPVQGLDYYRKSLTINHAMAAADPNNLQLRRALFTSLWWIGVTIKDTGDIDGSIENLGAALAIARELFDFDPKNIQAQNDLADAYMELAKTLTMKRETGKALENYRQAVENYEAVWARDRSNRHARRQIYYTQHHQADALAQNGDTNRAIELLRDTIEGLKELSLNDSANTEIQHDLALSRRKLGGMLAKNGDFTAALKNLRQSLPVFETLSAASPTNAKLRDDLTLTQFDIYAVSETRTK